MTHTGSRKPPETPHNRPISLSGADYLPPSKTAPRPGSDQSPVPARSSLTLTLRNASQRPPTLSTKYYPKQPHNQGQGIHEYQPKRGKILEFNNFRMVNLVNVGSRWSHKSQRFQGVNYLNYLDYLKSLLDLPGRNDLKVSEVSSSLFKFTLIVCFDVRG
jgi:hypothetical protein